MTWLPSGPALLFCPGSRPDRFAKAAARADVVILDLEDAVASEDKSAAREAVACALPKLDLARTIVRVNPLDTEWGRADVAACAAAGVLMLPKAEDPRALAELGDVRVLAICETAAGVLAAPDIARTPACAGLMWGGEDLVASCGGHASRRHDGTYHDVVRHARAAVLLAAAAAGKTAVDGVVLAIDDLDTVASEAAEAVSVGFVAKACIHPDHVPAIRAAFAPSADELAWASRLLDAAAVAGSGVFAHEGRMVDEPVLRHAQAIVARAPARGPRTA